MKPEQLNRANDIQAEISKLAASRDEVAMCIDDKGDQRLSTVYENRTIALAKEGWSTVYLVKGCMPMSFDEFKALYLLKIDARIKQLQEEFDNL